MEATQIPNSEFKIMVICMLKNLRERMDDLIENINKEIVSIKKDIETINMNQSEMKMWLHIFRNEYVK